MKNAEGKVVTYLCANGCGKPICPPSRVICRDCLDRITQQMEDMLAKMQDKEVENHEDL